MFTWVCPSCSKEWDLSVKECPECAAKPAPPPDQPAQIPDHPAQSRDREGADLRFWLLLGLGTAVGVTGLVSWVRYQSRRPPQHAVAGRGAPKVELSTPASEPGPESASVGLARDIEVAGIRLFYDSQNKPQVRAILINHGDEGLRNATVAVTLRPASSARDSPPLARLTAKIASEIEPG